MTDDKNKLHAITEPSKINLWLMRVQLSAMKLELKGLRHSSGRSVHKFVKETYGLKGPRKKLVEQFEALIEEKEKEAGIK